MDPVKAFIGAIIIICQDEKNTFGALAGLFLHIWVPPLPRSMHARRDNLDNTIASLAGFRSQVVGIV